MSTPRRISFDPVRISYVFFTSTLVLLGWLHLGIPLVAVLFSVFALRQLSFGMHRMLGLILFLLLLAGVGWGSVELTKRAYHILPQIAQESIPMVLDYAERKGVELPFTDYASLRSLLLDEVKERMAGWTPYARGVVGQLAAFVKCR